MPFFDLALMWTSIILLFGAGIILGCQLPKLRIVQAREPFWTSVLYGLLGTSSLAALPPDLYEKSIGSLSLSVVTMLVAFWCMVKNIRKYEAQMRADKLRATPSLDKE